MHEITYGYYSVFPPLIGENNTIYFRTRSQTYSIRNFGLNKMLAGIIIFFLVPKQKLPNQRVRSFLEPPSGTVDNPEWREKYPHAFSHGSLHDTNNREIQFLMVCS